MATFSSWHRGCSYVLVMKAIVSLLALARVASADAPGATAPLDSNIRRANIGIDPISPAFGYWDGAISYGVSSKLAITASAARWSRDHGRAGYQLSLGVPIFLQHLYSGAFIEPGVVLRTLTWPADIPPECINCQDVDPTDSYTWAGPQVLIGWQYMFQSGLNVACAVGVAKHLYESSVMEAPPPDPDVNAYFRVGYAF